MFILSKKQNEPKMEIKHMRKASIRGVTGGYTYNEKKEGV